jgi:pilus assembly protein Flp/PilA
MSSFIAAAKAFAADEDGITAIEYGLIAGTMVVLVATAFATLGPAIAAVFTKITDDLKAIK